MRWIKIISLCSVLFIIFSVFNSCLYNGYNAKMYSNHNDWISSSFLEDNKVRGAYYKHPDYIEGEDEQSEEYYCDEVSPKSRAIIIDNQTTMDSIFTEHKINVDFSKEIVYLYIFPDSHPYREYNITNISVKDETVYIYFKLSHSNKKDATAPYQRCLIVKMEKTNTSAVEFVKQK